MTALHALLYRVRLEAANQMFQKKYRLIADGYPRDVVNVLAADDFDEVMNPLLPLFPKMSPEDAEDWEGRE